MLDQCSSLVTLDRWGNIIRAEGARSLAGMLGPCSSLAELNLARNGIEALDDFDMPPTTCTTDHAAGLTPEPISALDRPGLDDDDTALPRLPGADENTPGSANAFGHIDHTLNKLLRPRAS